MTPDLFDFDTLDTTPSSDSGYAIVRTRKDKAADYLQFFGTPLYFSDEDKAIVGSLSDMERALEYVRRFTKDSLEILCVSRGIMWKYPLRRVISKRSEELFS